MTIYALTVARNEEQRYLRSFLENVMDWSDEHFLYDDQSEDETAYIASEYATVRIRPDWQAGFAEDEGIFRHNAWVEFESVMEPQERDWVFVIDCDEMVVAKDGHVMEAVNYLCDSIDVAYAIVFQEVFGFDSEGTPLVRVDGFWGQGFAPRLFPYHRRAMYAPGKVGVPAVPSYVMSQAGRWRQTDDISVMHYGYANEADHLVKFQRYSGVPGHHPDHIRSIISTHKMLVPWGGTVGEMVYAGDL